MKCPVCESIVDSIDPCPICVRDARKAAGKLSMPKWVGRVQAVALVLIVGWGLWSCAGSCSTVLTPTPDNPALAVKAQLAFADAGVASDLIDSVTAQADGSVIITLNRTAVALTLAGGANGARKLGAAYNAVVLDKVPEAKSVATFDANNTMLELSTRK